MFKKIILAFVFISTASALEMSVTKAQLVDNLINTAKVALGNTSEEKINQKSDCLGVSPSKLTNLAQVEKIITDCTADFPDTIDMADPVLRKGFVTCAKKEASSSLGVSASTLKKCF